MSEAVARAVGAASPMKVTIAGKQCTVRPLNIRELTEVERDCLERFKRSYLKTFSDNADLLPKGVGQEVLTAKLQECARWDVSDLPSKFAHDPAQIQVSKQLKHWLVGHFQATKEMNSERLQRLAASALDQGMLKPDEFKRLAAKEAPKIPVPYSTWWLTGCFDGMITLSWVCFRHNGVTREQVADELGNQPRLLSELSGEIERLSSVDLKNG